MEGPADKLAGNLIYKIVTAAQWAEAEELGEFLGAPIDLEDGYMHFSTSAQVVETVEKHFHGQLDLLIVSVDADGLGEALKWEPSRGGDLFPHLYANLAMTSVISVDDLPMGKGGKHMFPEAFAN
jgi:uncharacterized protein (DUF952 family)